MILQALLMWKLKQKLKSALNELNAKYNHFYYCAAD